MRKRQTGFVRLCVGGGEGGGGQAGRGGVATAAFERSVTSEGEKGLSGRVECKQISSGKAAVKATYKTPSHTQSGVKGINRVGLNKSLRWLVPF